MIKQYANKDSAKRGLLRYCYRNKIPVPRNLEPYIEKHRGKYQFNTYYIERFEVGAVELKVPFEYKECCEEKQSFKPIFLGIALILTGIILIFIAGIK